MANKHLSYSEFKAIFGDLGVTEWTKYNWTTKGKYNAILNKIKNAGYPEEIITYYADSLPAGSIISNNLNHERKVFVIRVIKINIQPSFINLRTGSELEFYQGINEEPSRMLKTNGAFKILSPNWFRYSRDEVIFEKYGSPSVSMPSQYTGLCFSVTELQRKTIEEFQNYLRNNPCEIYGELKNYIEIDVSDIL